MIRLGPDRGDASAEGSSDAAELRSRSGTRPRNELRENAPVLLGCTVGLGVGAHSLPFYTSGLFMAPLSQSFGWTRTQVSLAPTILVAGIALTAPLMGAVIDRYGERRVGVSSLAFVALGFVALSLMEGSLPAFYGIFALIALLGAGSATPTFSRVIARTFDAMRGTALGIGFVGIGVVSTLSPLLLSPVIAAQGWRSGYAVLAAVAAAATPAVAFLTRHASAAGAGKDAPGAAASGAELGAALRDPVFWILAATFACISLAGPGLIVHFMPMLLDQGVRPGEAAVLASAIGICLMVARLGAGMLVDLFFAPWIAAILMTLAAAALVATALGGAPYAICGAIAIGLSFGAEFDLVAYLCARYFGFRAYGRLYGFLYAAVLAGTSLSPLLYGALHDALGSYTAVLLVSAAALLAAAGMFLTLPRFDRPVRPGTAIR